MIRALTTDYEGYRFRSRLEARWACYFDHLGLKWEYEAQGYHFLGVSSYLPDFWLGEVRLFAEVKPGPFTAHELNLVRLLARESRFPVILLAGTPACQAYEFITVDGD